ncbi:type I polyketide synthase, partial [Paractinoplanes brasiliensis]
MAADAGTWLPSLRRDRDEPQAALTALAGIHVHGGPVDWAALLGRGPARPVGLPTYPFQRERFWPEVAAGAGVDRLAGLEAEFWDAVQRQDAAVVLPALASLRERQTRSQMAAWRYQVGWTRLTLPSRTVLSGTWAVVCDTRSVPDRPDAGAGLAGVLASAGVEVVVVDLADVAAGLTPDVVLAGGLVLPGTGPEAAARLLTVLQAWPQAGRLWVVTQGAVASAAGEPADAWQGSLWGLARVFGTESPDRWGGLIDLPAAGWDASLAADTVAVLAGWRGETQVAVRVGGALGMRLRPAAAPSGPGWRPSGTVLVTGGTGALGVRVAQWVAERGAQQVVLTSRRGMTAPGAANAVQQLADAGIAVHVVAADAADRPALDALVARIPDLDAVVHTAGVLDDGIIDSLTPERLDVVARAKIDAVVALDEATAGRNLSAFVLFSSMAALAGSPGQGNYAAANAFLDTYAQQRRAQGVPMVSIGWGAWAGAGLADTDLVRGRTNRSGLAGMDPAVAVTALAHALDGDGYLTVAQTDWAQLAAGLGVPAWLSELPDMPEAAGRTGERVPALAAQVREAAAAQREALVLAAVRDHAATVLGHRDAGVVEQGVAFRDLGFDSLTAVELRNLLAAVTGLALPASLVFDYPTPLALAEFLLGELTGSASAAGPVTAAVAMLDEPIAIVGMSCRFPGGVGNAEQLWELLAAGRDGVGDFPADRGWDLSVLSDGATVIDQGGFLADVAGFDAAFFGISPREALAMDPQQRILLETTWRALEDAGIDPGGLRGSATGVYVGTNGQDYPALLSLAGSDGDGFIGTGNAASVISGRLAYTLGLEGPAVSVDTACSSSLVALHLAGQALRSGECSLALAGGVTVMATPSLFLEFSKQGGLAADGRCKAFSDSADGTGWGEGAGVLVLERLSDARRNGHQVLAVVRGSAVNQDGASNGLSAPNGPSQQRVIRQALANAGLAATDIDAVEAHGTGTRLGDPIEAQALLATYGQDRSSERPLWLGSVKSNLGHTQAAAGVAGLIKMVLAMRHGVLPRTLHADTRSSQVDWTAGAIELLTESRDWDVDGRPRRAGVSAFGISGTNAHVILEEAAPEPAVQSPAVSVVPWLLSARSEQALREQAAELREFVLARPELDLARVGRTLAWGRAALPHRAVVVGTGRDELLAALADVDSVRGVAGSGAGGAVFVFPGQGAQWVGMGLALWDSEPAFAETMSRCEEALAPYTGWLLHEVLSDSEALDRVDVVQPALWAVMVSLAELWRYWGVEPGAVIGHSQGEIAAAVVSGGLSLADGARVVALRSQAIAAIAGGGGMVSVPVPVGDVESLLEPFGLAVAAVNGPSQVVVAGPAEGCDRFVETYPELNARRIAVDYASHTAGMEPLRDRLDLAGLTPVAGSVPFFSTVYAEPIDTSRLDGDYWFTNLRQTVRFADTVEALVEAGHKVFVELSPHPVLTMAVEQAGDGLVVTGSLRRNDDTRARWLRSVATLHTAGVAVDWTRVLGEGPARPMSLPVYPFQRERYWPRLSGAWSGDAGALGLSAANHPLLGAAVRLADGDGVLLTGRLSLVAQPWLADHMVLGTVLLAGTAFVEVAVWAADQVGCTVVDELTLQTPLLIPEQGAVQVQVWVGDADESGRRPVNVYSRPEQDESPWTRHATGVLSAQPAAGPAERLTWPPSAAEPIGIDGVYERLAADGYGYGPAFQGLRAVWRSESAVYAEVTLPDPADADRFGLHPALLDAATHAIGVGGLVDGERVLLPFAWNGVRLHATGAVTLRVRLTRHEDAADAVRVVAYDLAGEPVLTAEALLLRELAATTATDATRSLYAVELRPVAAVEGSGPSVVVWSPPVGGVTETVVAALARVQEWLADPASDDARLVVLTRGAADGEDLAAAAVWGLVRSAQSEHPGRFVLLDADQPSEEILAHAAAADETELILRDGVLHARRLVRAGVSLSPVAGQHLDIVEKGTLDNLAVVPCPEAVAGLAVGQVRVGVHAQGLNFRDVLMGLGMYPDPDAVMGSEFSGVVLEVGPGVAGLSVGDRVFGLNVGLGPVVVTDQRLVTRVPQGWSFTDAASVPVVFLTAFYALRDLAEVRPGERILIHAGAGGVGMAAIQLAQAWGLEVYATASPAKQEVLHGLGLPLSHVASSRDLEFRDKFAGGVDVVLNALTGEFIDASLELLAPGGRFVEMGKADIRDPEGVNYRAFDLMEAGPDRLGEMLAELVEMFAAGSIRLLPVTVFEVSRAVDALRYLQAARHVGKVVLRYPAAEPDGTVLITGGTGALGSMLARHLAETARAGEQLLLSRQGAHASGAPRLAADLAEAGTRVRITVCDAADRAG